MNNSRPDNFERDLRELAPLTAELAPHGFVESVMARIAAAEQPKPLPSVVRTGRTKLNRLLPLVAAAAVVIVAMSPTVRRSISPMTAMMSPKAESVADQPLGNGGGENTMRFAAVMDGAPEEAESEVGVLEAQAEQPAQAATGAEETPVSDVPEQNLKDGSDGNEYPVLTSAYRSSLALGGPSPDSDGDKYELIYGQPANSAGVSFCVVLRGGLPPEGMTPIVPNQYLMTADELEELLSLQPEGVIPEYTKEGLTATAPLGLVIFK